MSRKRTIRVLVVGDSRSRHVERLAEALASHGIPAAVAAFEPNELALPMHRLSRLPPTNDLRYALAIPALARLIRRSRTQVVHAHYLSSYGVMAAAAVKVLAMTGGPRPCLIQTVWGTDLLVTPQRLPLMRALSRFALRSADAVTGDSDELHEAARAYAKRPIRWLDFFFGPSAALLRKSRTPQPGLFLSPRNITRAMRVERIVATFIAARNSVPALRAARLIVCGRVDGLDVDATGFGEGAGVEFVGELPMTDLQNLLLSSHAFISIPETDGTSATLLEGMAAGSVPIVNRLRANLQWVSDETGILVDADPTVSQLSAAFEAALDPRFQPARIRAAVKDATWENQTARLFALYDDLGRPETGNA